MTDGAESLRVKLILSVLSGKPIKLKNIRRDEDEPGLQDYEVNLLKLIDLITNGTRTDINETGTSLYFVPGLLIGGTFEFDCKLERSISYYLQVLFCIGPFGKKPLDITFKGITNDSDDLSIDYLKYSSIPVIKRFIGSDDGLELKIVRRGAKPKGGGEVTFTCPTKTKLIPINLTDPGKIKRIRGIAYAMRVAPAVCNRLVETAKGVLLKFLPDVYIVTDHQKRENAGNSPAFGLTLVAETISGTFLCGEACSISQDAVLGKDAQDPSVPEDIALLAAKRLLEEVNRGGCIDSSCQHLSFLFMALNQRDISRILSGILSPFSIEFLRSLRENFEVKFKIEPCRQNREIDINHKRLKEEKEEAEREKKNTKKRKRNLQLPQEIADDKEDEIESDGEIAKKKQKAEAEETEKSVQDYLRLGHEKLLMSCLGIGFTNLTKTLV